MKLEQQNYFNDGKLWKAAQPRFDEIMQVIYLNVNEICVNDHKRMTTASKYSISIKKFTISISLKTPQVVNALKDGSMADALNAVGHTWKQYLDYAINETNPSLIAFTVPYNNTVSTRYKEKLTSEEVMQHLGVNEDEYNQYIIMNNPY